MIRAFRLSSPRKISFVAGLLVAFAAFAGGSVFTANKVYADIAPLCNSNVIIYCGTSSPSDFIAKVKANDSKNGHHDIQGIYNNYGLSSADYTRFVNEAVQGTVYRDGRVVVGGKTVLTGAQNLGREQDTQGSGAYAVKIGNTTYYGNSMARTFRTDQDALKVFVLFDKTGTVEFIVAAPCGNPIWGTPVKTSAACTQLTSNAVSGKLNTYDFTASASVSGNATITKYVYDFGDGSPTVTTTSGTQAVRHAYTKGGNFTAKVTVFASVPGNSNLQLPAVSTCQKVITVQIPFANCVVLTPTVINKEKFEYSFAAKANYGNGATFKSADFTFGDGKTATVSTIANNVVTVTHAYDKAGTYNIGATLHFTAAGSDLTAPTCTAMVSPNEETPTCKPGIPVGDVRCNPCQYDASLPADSPKCVPPVLPNTGAGNTIAIFAGVVVAGFLVYRQLLFRKHKAAFLAAEQGTSPLPLGDPMSDTPLAGTPLETKRRIFRRKRQF